MATNRYWRHLNVIKIFMANKNCKQSKKKK